MHQSNFNSYLILGLHIEREREVLKILGEIKRNYLRSQCFSIGR